MPPPRLLNEWKNVESKASFAVLNRTDLLAGHAIIERLVLSKGELS